LSAHSTNAKVIERTIRKFLPEQYGPLDIFWRPYDSTGGDAGWTFVIEDEASRSAAMNVGHHPTKLMVKRALEALVEKLSVVEKPESQSMIQKPTPGQVRNLSGPHD